MLMQAPGMDKQQQRLMMLIPLVMVIFIIRFPAGLIIYWITTNAWTMTQQYVIRRMMGPPPVPVTAAGATTMTTTAVAGWERCSVAAAHATAGIPQRGP